MMRKMPTAGIIGRPPDEEVVVVGLSDMSAPNGRGSPDFDRGRSVFDD